MVCCRPVSSLNKKEMRHDIHSMTVMYGIKVLTDFEGSVLSLLHTAKAPPTRKTNPPIAQPIIVPSETPADISKNFQFQFPG